MATTRPDDRGKDPRTSRRTGSESRSGDAPGRNAESGRTDPGRTATDDRRWTVTVQERGRPWLRRTPTALAVGATDDPAEREAERVATRLTGVRRRPNGPDEPPRPGLCPCCRSRLRAGRPLDCPDCEATLRRQARADDPAASPDTDAVGRELRGSRGRGRPLPTTVRTAFESRFGEGLDDVRIHDGPHAARLADAVDAHALTYGRDVYFEAGGFRPGTAAGDRLLAHELTHVVQQRGRSRPVVRRQARARGAAGGCGLCLPKPAGATAGRMAHSQIQSWLFTQFPQHVGTRVAAEYMAPHPDSPRPDFVVIDTRGPVSTAHIAEIKPVGESQGREATKEISDYHEAIFRHEYDEVFRIGSPNSTLSAPRTGSLPFADPSNPLGCPPQTLTVRLTAPGVYQYHCDPPWSTLIALPNCPCSDRIRDRVPYPVPFYERVEVRDLGGERDPNVDPDADVEEVPDPWTFPIPDLEPETVLLLAAGTLAAGIVAAVSPVRKAKALAALGVLLIALPAGAEIRFDPSAGGDPVEQLFRLLEENGTPAPPELRERIMSDPELKRLVEESIAEGGLTEAQQRMNREAARLVEQNIDQFSDTELARMIEATETASGVGTAPSSVEELKRSLQRARATKGTGVDGEEGGTGSKGETTQGEATQGGTTEGGETTAGTMEGGETLGPRLPEGTPDHIRRLLDSILGGEGPGRPEATDEFVAEFRRLTAGLTEEEAARLQSGLVAVEGDSLSTILERLEAAVASVRESTDARAGGGDGDAVDDASVTAETGGVTSTSTTGGDSDAYAAEMRRRIRSFEQWEETSSGSAAVVLPRIRAIARAFQANPKGKHVHEVTVYDRTDTERYAGTMTVRVVAVVAGPDGDDPVVLACRIRSTNPLVPASSGAERRSITAAPGTPLRITERR